MTPLVYVELDEKALGIDARELQTMLRKGDPPIETLYEPSFLIEDYAGRMTINPEYMLSGDDEMVVKRIKEIVEASKT